MPTDQIFNSFSFDKVTVANGTSLFLFRFLNVFDVGNAIDLDITQTAKSVIIPSRCILNLLSQLLLYSIPFNDGTMLGLDHSSVKIHKQLVVSL